MTAKTPRRSTTKHQWSAELEVAVVAKQAELRCGIARLAKAMPQVDRRVLTAMFDRLNLHSGKYQRWTPEDEARLISRHVETGWGGQKLASEFPGYAASSITTKLSQLRNAGKVPSAKSRKKTIYNNEQHRQFREFVLARRLTHRIPELTELWNQRANAMHYPEATQDMVRYWTRRKQRKYGNSSPEVTNFSATDRARKRERSLKNAKQIEAAASKAHEEAKKEAALDIAAHPKHPISHCRWCVTDYPLSSRYFKKKGKVLVSGICLWCRDKQRRELRRATLAGPATLAQYKARMKREKRTRFYDARWKAIEAELKAKLPAIRARKRPPLEQSCIACTTSYPLVSPYFREPRKEGHSWSRICCFCEHDYDIRIARAKADGHDEEDIRQERRSLLLRANRVDREAKKAKLLRLAKQYRGSRAPCCKCETAWPIDPRIADTFWRFDRGRRSNSCLPCTWDYDAERNQSGRKRKKKPRRS